MNISTLCTREIVSVAADASVRDAAAAMLRSHVGAVVVTDTAEPGRAIGMVTDRDLVLKLLATGRSPQAQPIGALCSNNLVGVPSTASVQEAVRTMQKEGVRRLLVAEPGGSLLGVLSADDLFEAIAGELGGLAGALREGSAREGVRTAPGADIARALYLTRNEP